MKRRAITATILPTGTACLAMGANSASAGLGPAEWSIHLTASGPGMITGSIGIRDTSFLLTTTAAAETLIPTPDGNNAEFRGWVGACAPAEASTLVVTAGGVAMGGGAPCRWTAAQFAFPGEPTPSVANPLRDACRRWLGRWRRGRRSKWRRTAWRRHRRLIRLSDADAARGNIPPGRGHRGAQGGRA